MTDGRLSGVGRGLLPIFHFAPSMMAMSFRVVALFPSCSSAQPLQIATLPEHAPDTTRFVILFKMQGGN
jgi:hypothetical protein